jgi:hypothetical protein
MSRASGRTAAAAFLPPGNYKRRCWAGRHCAGKVLGKFTHAHNCWNAGGKWGDASPQGRCQNKTR